MVEKRYEWAEGAKIEEHSRRKHKILREYVFDYLTVRCRLPQQERFRLAIVDGFAGGGRYQCGTAGSPLIFIEELKRAVEAVNTQRAAQGLGTIEIECLLIFNDASRDAIELLKTHIAPMRVDIEATCRQLHLRVEYLNEFFEVAYPKIKGFLEQGRYRSVLFNLDQRGHSHVERGTILDIMHSYPAAKIEVKRIMDAYATMMPEVDTNWPGAGIGLVASVDQVRKTVFPVVFGQNLLQPWQMTGFSSAEEWWNWCRQDRTIAAEVAFAAADLHDLTMGLNEIEQGNTSAMTLWKMARSNLEDAANTLRIDIRGPCGGCSRVEAFCSQAPNATLPMPSSLPLLFPAGNLTRKTPVMNDPVFGDQRNPNKAGKRIQDVENGLRDDQGFRDDAGVTQGPSWNIQSDRRSSWRSPHRRTCFQHWTERAHRGADNARAEFCRQIRVTVEVNQASSASSDFATESRKLRRSMPSDREPGSLQQTCLRQAPTNESGRPCISTPYDLLHGKRMPEQMLVGVAWP